MSACSFSRLLQFINKQLDLDGQLEVYHHLDRCDICHDAVYQLARDLDGAFLINRAPCGTIRRTAPYRRGSRISGCVQMITNAPASTAVRFRLKSVVLKDVPETTGPLGPGSEHTIRRI